MKEYLIFLRTVLLVYIAAINLWDFKIKFFDLIALFMGTSLVAFYLAPINLYVTTLLAILSLGFYIYMKNRKSHEAVFVPIFSLIITILSDTLVANGYIIFFNGHVSIVQQSIKLYFIFFFFNIIVVYTVSKVLGRFIKENFKNWTSTVKGKFKLISIIMLFLTIVIFYANIILSDNSNTDKNEVVIINGILVFSYFILLLITLYILFRSLVKELELKDKEGELENLQQYTMSLEKLYSDMRSFRHDYINILSSMIGYIDNKDMEGLKGYFTNKIVPLTEHMEKNNFSLDLLKNIHIPEIKGILSSKLIAAQELGIDITLDIMDPIEKINMDIVDISRCLGILLDNAIEAVVSQENPYINIGFITKKNSLIIIIVNPCVENVHIYQMFKKGFSTKGENRGLGLSNLKNILNRYDNVFLETTLEDRTFKQILEINTH